MKAAVAIYNNKGGVGKSVTSANLAYNLSAIGKRILAVDLDAQGNLSGFYDRYDLNKNSAFEMLTGQKRPKQCRYRTKYENLDIIPANIKLAGNVETYVVEHNLPGLRENLGAFQDEYDYILMDCPPAIGWMMQQALTAATDVIIPLYPDRFSSDGLWTTMEIVENTAEHIGHEHIGVLFTKCRRNRDTKAVTEQLLDMMGSEYFFSNVIRDSPSVGHSIRMRKPLLKGAAKSNVTLDYLKFTQEFLQKVGDDDESE